MVAEFYGQTDAERITHSLSCRNCFVGLRSDGQLIEWSPMMWDCYALIPSADDDMIGMQSQSLARFPTIGELESWIRSQEWAWLHPRFRWVIET